MLDQVNVSAGARRPDRQPGHRPNAPLTQQAERSRFAAIRASFLPGRSPIGGHGGEASTDLTQAHPAAAPSKPGEGRRERFQHHGSMLRRTLHLRLHVARALSGLLPDFLSGVIRGRVYRWAGFDVDPSAFLMGRLNLVSGYPDFYSKLVIGPGATIAGPATFNLDAVVTIGKSVAIAPHVLIFTGWAQNRSRFDAHRPDNRRTRHDRGRRVGSHRRDHRPRRHCRSRQHRRRRRRCTQRRTAEFLRRRKSRQSRPPPPVGQQMTASATHSTSTTRLQHQ
jgi:hypothetical protein